MPDKKTLADYLAESRQRHATAEEQQQVRDGKFTVEDFYAHLPDHHYIFVPTRSLWTMAGVNACLPKVQGVKASTIIDKNRGVQQMTWAPGMDMLIHHRFIVEGGWIPHPGATCFNLYRPPPKISGDPEDAEPWLAHIRKVYPDDADHIVLWCAQRVQEPQVKINHALVLGGSPGIGKDTMLAPVIRAVGAWNCAEITPAQAMGRFNGFLKSVILRINEARDLGEASRFDFYDHMKWYIAAPPEVLRIDEKHIPEHHIPNVCGVIITTNHKTDGIFLPADDRRHYVAWSPRQQTDFPDNYWNTLWAWYENGGYENVAAFLQQLDISELDPKAPPPKTRAFWDIVGASSAPEDSELADLIEYMRKTRRETNTPDPDLKVVTLAMLTAAAAGELLTWLTDRKNRRSIPHRLERNGYVPVRNDINQGLWKIYDKRTVVYARTDLTLREQVAAAQNLQQSTSSQ